MDKVTRGGSTIFQKGGYFCKGRGGVIIHCLITKIYKLGAYFLYFSYALAQNGGWLVTLSNSPWIRPCCRSGFMDGRGVHATICCQVDLRLFYSIYAFWFLCVSTGQDFMHNNLGHIAYIGSRITRVLISCSEQSTNRVYIVPQNTAYRNLVHRLCKVCSCWVIFPLFRLHLVFPISSILCSSLLDMFVFV